MIISDLEIDKLIKNNSIRIKPYFKTFQGPVTYYCHLGNRFMIMDISKIKENNFVLDTNNIENTKYCKEIVTNEPYIIKPQEFLLAQTFEKLSVDNKHIINYYNSSSLARLGISQAALGFMPSGNGWKNNGLSVTLELINNSPFPIKLYPTTIDNDGNITFGTEVLKISVSKIFGKISTSHDNWKFTVYSNSMNVTSSKISNRFTNSEEIFNINNKF